MDKPRVTPKDFVLWFGAMTSLYAGVVAMVALLFDYINTAFPNAVTNAYYYADPYQNSGISYQIASLIVLTPVLMILMRLIRRDIARDPSRNEIWVRRWAIFLTLFLAGAAMVVDLIVLITAFLQGEELTVGFLFKIVIVLLLAILGFLHFLADIRGYWDRERARARSVNYAVGVLFVCVILAGFFIVGTPQQIRAKKQDALRLNDLQNIQWQVVNYWQQKEKLPVALADLNDPISGTTIPVDPKTGQPYEYKTTGPVTFQLCATFVSEGNNASIPMSRSMDVSEPMATGTGVQDSWAHAAGRACFERTIDPERYPPFKTTK